MPDSPERQPNLERAVRAYEALQRCFHRRITGLYLETYPRQGGNRYSFIWPFSQALAATIDMSELPAIGARYRGHVRSRLRGLAWYWNRGATPPAYDSYVRPPLGRGGDRYYDDNHWIGLELVRLYRTEGGRDALEHAEQIFRFAVSGWDTNPHHPAPGGVFWVQAAWNRDRGTVCNAPAAQLGLRLYQITRQPSYREWAERMYDWTNAHLLAPNGLYWDKIDLDGAVDESHWSYNQGTMIGAGVLLYRVTGDRAHLARAERVAHAALEYYGGTGGYDAQPAVFNAIFFKNLLLLGAENGNPAYREAMQSYADRVWEVVRDPATDLFRFERDRPVPLLDQAAMVQIYARLAQDRRDAEA